MKIIDGKEFYYNLDVLNSKFYNIELNYSDLNNTLVLVNEDIEGLLTCDLYGKYAFIKYFVIRKNGQNYVKDLLEAFKDKLHDKVNSFVIFSNYDDSYKLEEIGFKKASFQNLYFGEVNYLKTDYKNKQLYVLDFRKYS